LSDDDTVLGDEAAVPAVERQGSRHPTVQAHCGLADRPQGDHTAATQCAGQELPEPEVGRLTDAGCSVVLYAPTELGRFADVDTGTINATLDPETVEARLPIT
jgi:hypothetical protein